MRALHGALALVMFVSAPLSADAQRGGGGGGGGFHGGGAPAGRPAAPAFRPAAPPRANGGGFNVGSEFAHPNPPAQIARPVNPGNGGGVRPPGFARPPAGYPPRPGPPPGGFPAPRPPHTIITNPGYRGPAWGWNGGVRWNPASGYWGGGFWGGFALAAISAYAFGSIVDAQNQTLYSYQVAPGSPGAQLLQNYQLTQTNCDQADLVIIDGPEDSLICAYPNQLVGPGNYTVDPTALTLLSE